MITHEEAHDLLAAFSLDAMETNELRAIEDHLAECPRCRAEVDAHREVAAALGNSVEPLPEGLWESISSRLPDRHDGERPPMPVLLRNEVMAGEATADRHRPTAFRSARARFFTLAATAAAAAAVVAVLGVNLVQADNQVAHLRGALDETSHTAVLAAEETLGHKDVTLESADHQQLARFVTVPSGQGYLVTSALPKLPPGETYQLWGVVQGQPISLGLLGQKPQMVTYTLAGSVRPSKLGITIEPAGGSAVPTKSMLASGIV
jgi:anti-sigma-K factor RskA